MKKSYLSSITARFAAFCSLRTIVRATGSSSAPELSGLGAAIWVFAAGVLLLSSCAAPKYSGRVYGEQIPAFLHDTVEYRINSGDQLTIQSFNNLSSVVFENNPTAANSPRQGQVPEFTVWVEEDGEVVLPRAGRVELKGLTEEEAAAAVEKAYASTIKDPAFYVYVSNRRVKVLGAVYQQGMYPLTRHNQTLGEVLALAGGVNFEQLGKQLILTRPGVSGDSSLTEPMIFDLDLHNLSDPDLTNIVVHSNDVIYLPPSRAVVSAAQFRNISAFIQPVLLVLNSIILINTLAK